MARFYDLKTDRFFDLSMFEDEMPDYATDFACCDLRTRWSARLEVYTVPDGEYMIDEAIDWQLRQGYYYLDPENTERSVSYCWINNEEVRNEIRH